MGVRVGVIGAGIAGLSAALRLREAGAEVVVVDKGRGVGGRASTRRGPAAAFDHGAPCFRVASPEARAILDRHVPPGTLVEWAGRFAVLDADGLRPHEPESPVLVGVPGMSALAKGLAATLEVRVGFQAEALSGAPGRWTIADAAGEAVGPFDWVVATAPPPQSAALLAGRTPLAEAVGSVAMRPTFALMLTPADPDALPFDAIRCDHPALSWVAAEHRKPGRPATPAVVVQSSHAWAEARRDDDRAAVGEALRTAAATALGVDLGVAPIDPAAVHRWLYAAPARPLGRPCLIDPDARLAACGDWCPGGQVEGALRSGEACARAILDADA